VWRARLADAAPDLAAEVLELRETVARFRQARDQWAVEVARAERDYEREPVRSWERVAAVCRHHAAENALEFMDAALGVKEASRG
jgi:hypothetical protein